MSAESRIAWVATPSHSPEARSGQGTLDGEAVLERLGQPDLGFHVVALDASDDLAGQLDDWALSTVQAPALSVLYVSAPVISVEGEVLLCLDPSDPTTGDSFADVLGSLVESTDGPVVGILDLRAPPSTDALTLASLVGEVREVVRGLEQAEVLVSLRAADEQDASACSPLTRALLEALDEVEPSDGLSFEELYERMAESSAVLEAKLAFGAVTRDPTAVLLEPESAGASNDVSQSTPPTEEGDVHVETQIDAEPDNPAPAPDDATSALDSRASDSVVEPRVEPDVALSASKSSSLESSTVSVPAPSSSDVGRVSRVPMSEPPPSRRSIAPTASSEAEQGDRLAAAGDDEGALGLYRRALGLVGPSPGEGVDPSVLRASLHVRIGEAKLRQGKSREAVAAFEKALGLSPTQHEVDRVLKLLLSLYMGERDHRSAANVQARLLDRVTTTDDRVVALSSFARSWLHDADEPLRARALLEEARALAPSDPEVLRSLLELAERDRRADDIVELRKLLAELEQDPIRRAAELLTLGRELVSVLRREDDALHVLEAALEAHPSELEPLVLLAQVLADRQEWSELEGAYHRMLDRLPRVEPAEVHRAVEAEIARRLGNLLRDHLEDESGALSALERAVAAQPSDLDSRRAAAELARSLGEHRRALAHAQFVAERSPRTVKDLRRLFDLLMKCELVERACHVAEVLVVLERADERERALLEAHRDDVRRPVEELPPDAWERLWVEEQLPVAHMFEAAGEALYAGLVELWRKQGDAERVGDAKAVDPATTTLSAPRSLAWATKMLRLPLPQVYVDDTSSAAFRALRKGEPTTIIGGPALRGRSLEELSFLAGYHVAAGLPAHRPVFLAHGIDELSACFLSAVREVMPEAPVPESLAGAVGLLRAALDARLDDEARHALDVAFIELDEQGGQVDLGAWAEAAERSALAAGLLLSGDLRVARSLLEHLPEGVSSERRFELLLGVALSEAYSDLRLRMSGAAG
jgi:tetratricopeptide (TPR) repeat protein